MDLKDHLWRVSRSLGRKLLPQTVRDLMNDAILDRQMQPRRAVVTRLLERCNPDASRPFRVLVGSREAWTTSCL